LERLPPAAGGQKRQRSEDLPEKVAPVTRFPQTPAEFRNISRRVLCFSKNFGLIFVRLSNVDFVRLISYEGIDVPNKITLTNAKNNRICNAN
jgi:hypothetical protein